MGRQVWAELQHSLPCLPSRAGAWGTPWAWQQQQEHPASATPGLLTGQTPRTLTGHCWFPGEMVRFRSVSRQAGSATLPAVLSCPWPHPLPWQCPAGRGSAPRAAAHRAEPPGSSHTSVCPWHDSEGGTPRDAVTPNSSTGPFCTCGSQMQAAKGDLHPDGQSQATQARTRWVTLSHTHPQVRCPGRCIHRRRGGVCSGGAQPTHPMQTAVQQGFGTRLPHPTSCPRRQARTVQGQRWHRAPASPPQQNLFSRKGAPQCR